MINKIAYIVFKNYKLGSNCSITITDKEISYNEDNDICLKVRPNNISKPKELYDCVINLVDNEIIKRNFLLFSNGYLYVKVPIVIILSIDSFFWKNVIFEKEIFCKINSKRFYFNKNTCIEKVDFEIGSMDKDSSLVLFRKNIFKQDVLFTFSDNLRSIDFSESYFMRHSKFHMSEIYKTTKKDILFCYCIFGSKDKNSSVNFSDFKFGGSTYFSNTIFHNNVYFNNSIFYDYTDFHASIFENVVSFYNVDFKSIPNFSTCVFRDAKATNFINVDISNIEITNIEQFIDRYKDDDLYNSELKRLNKINNSLEKTNNKMAQEIAIKYKICYTNTIRDSFRTIKYILITNNNLLDASQWHKIELYAKEKELEFLMEKAEFEHQNKHPILNMFETYLLSIKTFWIDNVLLQIYRVTSEHHTNFTAILNFTITMICVYAFILWIYSKLLLNFINDSTIELYNFCSIIIIALLIFLILIISRNNIIIKLFFTGIFCFYLFIVLELVLLYVYFTDITFCYILFYFTIQIAIIIFIYYIYLSKKTMIGKIIYKILVLVSYIGLLIVILKQPVLINPLIGVFNTDMFIEKRLEMELNNTPNYILISLAKDLTEQSSIKYCCDCSSAEIISIAKDIVINNRHKLIEKRNEKYLQNNDYKDMIKNIIEAVRYDDIMNHIFKTTIVIYSIILLLCIFSLQKTARKNSIIPS